MILQTKILLPDRLFTKRITSRRRDRYLNLVYSTFYGTAANLHMISIMKSFFKMPYILPQFGIKLYYINFHNGKRRKSKREENQMFP